MASFFSTLFGGGAERDAANRNRWESERYGQQGLASLDEAMTRGYAALTGHGGNANRYYGDTYDLYGGVRDRGMGYLDSARTNSIDALNRGRANYDSVDALAKKYGGATSLLLDSLGVNGAEGNARAVQNFQAGPGYQFTMDQGIQALNRARAARGMLNSGNTDVDAMTFGTGLANQTYGQWQDRLGGFREGELAATNAAASGRSQFDRAAADLYQSDAQNRIGLENTVATGRAAANAGRAGTEQWLGNSLASLYSQDAQNRLGVYNNVMNGNVNANNFQAQGQAQGGRNFLNTAMGLANLGFGKGGFFRS